MQYAHVRVAGVLMLGYFALYAKATSDTESTGSGMSGPSNEHQIQVMVNFTGTKSRLTKPRRKRKETTPMEEEATLDLINGEFRFKNNIPEAKSKLIPVMSAGCVDHFETEIENRFGFLKGLEIRAKHENETVLFSCWRETFHKMRTIPVKVYDTIDSTNFDGQLEFHDIMGKDMENVKHKFYDETRDRHVSQTVLVLKAPRLRIGGKIYDVKKRHSHTEYQVYLSNADKPHYMILNVNANWSWAMHKLNLRLEELVKFEIIRTTMAKRHGGEDAHSETTTPTGSVSHTREPSGRLSRAIAEAQKC